MNAAVQLSDEWFAQRVGRITGSRVGTVLGVNPYSKPEELLREMVREYHGAEKEFTGNRFTEWGQAHEQDALDAIAEHIGEEITEAPLVVHPEHDWLAASPDGFVGDHGICETKCPQSIKELSEVPHYLAQIQLQLHCTGREHCFFGQWTEDEIRIDLVELESDWLERHLPTLQAFRDLYLETIASEELSAPHLEPLVVDMSEDETWHAMAERLQEITAQKKELESEEKAIKQELIEIAAGRKSAGFGVTVFPTTRNTTDYKALIKDAGIDPEQYQKQSTSWTVRVSG